MTEKPQKRRADGWLKTTAMCCVFDITSNSFRRYVLPLIPSDGVRRSGRTTLIHARTAVEAWAAHRYAGVGAMAATGNGDSPGLEAYRQARAELARLDLAERRGELVNVEQLNAAWARVAAVLRRGSALVERQFGSEARDVFDQALDAADKIMRKDGDDDD